MGGFGHSVAKVILAMVPGMLFGAETLTIKGSNTFGEELGPILIQQFKAIAPQAVVELESQGSGSGLAALLDGKCDMASSSRPANEDEARRAKSRAVRLKSHVIGYYGVAVIVNAANPVQRLADRQVADLFAGSMVDWSAAGGTPGKVVLVTREKTAGAYLGFQELALGGRAYAATAQACASDQEVARQVARDPRAVGYVSFARLNEPGVRAVTINFAAPTRWEVNQNTYPYARGLRLYTNGEKESELTKRFVDFVRSKSGQQVLSEAGFVGFAEPQMLPTMEP
jgi:phosphate transport system substrate-binding protein